MNKSAEQNESDIVYKMQFKALPCVEVQVVVEIFVICGESKVDWFTLHFIASDSQVDLLQMLL
jgi:hypothetical protein